MSNKIDRLWAFAILFINGWNLALPVTSEALPVWFTPVQVVHGVFIHELLLLIYLGVKVVTGGGYLPIRKHAPGNNIALLIIGLGCLGVLSNVVNSQPLREMGEAGRLFLLAAYFLLSTYWAKRHGPTFVLWSLLIGIACAGVINLYYSFTIRYMELGGLPFLLGQKGPGGSLGLMVILSAWLMLEGRKGTLNAAVAIVLAGMGVFCASITYSKLAILMAGFGLIAWSVALCRGLVKRSSRKPIIVILFVLFAFAFVYHVKIGQYLRDVNTFIFYKFHNITMNNTSISARSQYLISVAEIVSRYPLLGVGSGGFYDAVTATDRYKNHRGVAKENAEAGAMGKSNPHNAFLYYASANGLPGLLLTIVLFLSILRALWRSLSGHGVPGRVIWVCLAGAYVVYGMAVPSLFNTAILYVPAAVAIAITHQTYSGHQKFNYP